MTVFFLPLHASCYFPEAPTATNERKRSEEKQREKGKQWLRDQMKKKKRSAGLTGLHQRTDITSRLQRICKLAIPTPSESRMLTMSSAPFTWEPTCVTSPASSLSQCNANGNRAQSCPTLCDPTDCPPPGFSVHGIFQARILEWVAISYSRGSSQPRVEPVSSVAPASAGEFFTTGATWEAILKHQLL